MQKSFTDAEFWNDKFQEDTFVYGLKPNDFLKENKNLFKKGDKILSLAEGEGRNCVFLAKQGCKARGVDFSESGREKAFKLADMMNVKIDYDVADISNYELGKNKWDAIISIFFPMSEEILSNLSESIHSSLKEGGIFLLESYNKKQLNYNSGGPKNVSYLLSISQIKKIFTDFDIIHAKEIEREIHEGNLHNGLSSVTQFIARRRKLK